MATWTRRKNRLFSILPAVDDFIKRKRKFVRLLNRSPKNIYQPEEKEGNTKQQLAASNSRRLADSDQTTPPMSNSIAPISSSNNINIDPSLHERQRQLKKARLADSLNDKLSHRPGVLEQVQGNILQTDGKITQLIKGIEGSLSFEAAESSRSATSHQSFSVMSPQSAVTSPQTPIKLSKTLLISPPGSVLASNNGTSVSVPVMVTSFTGQKHVSAASQQQQQHQQQVAHSQMAAQSQQPTSIHGHQITIPTHSASVTLQGQPKVSVQSQIHKQITVQGHPNVQLQGQPQTIAQGQPQLDPRAATTKKTKAPNLEFIKNQALNQTLNLCPGRSVIAVSTATGATAPTAQNTSTNVPQTSTAAPMTLNGLTQPPVQKLTASLPTSPVEGSQRPVARTASNPFFIPMKEPPKYDEAVRNKPKDNAPSSKPVQDIAVPRVDDQQTKRTPCAPEDSMHHDDTKSALTDPDLTNKGKINFLPTVVVLDTSSRTSSTEDITQSIEKIFNFIDRKIVIKYEVIGSPNQKKIILKNIKNKIESEENIDKLESATSSKIETHVYPKKHIPAQISRIITTEVISNIRQVILVSDEDTMQIAVKLLDTTAISFFPWNTLKPLALDQTNDKTLSDIETFIKDDTSLTIFDADNCNIKICMDHVQQNPKLKSLVFGNKKTMKLIDKYPEVKNNTNVFFGPPSLEKKEAADCDIVKVIVYIAVKHPHIEIRVVSDDSIFKMFTKRKRKGKRKNSDVNNENPFSASITILNPRKMSKDGQEVSSNSNSNSNLAGSNSTAITAVLSTS